MMAIATNRDGNLSAMHRYLKNHGHQLCQRVGLRPQRVIARVQLPRLLAKANQPFVSQLVSQQYGLTLTDSFTDWLSGDGKELRGSIQKGHKRGEVCVSIIAQQQQAVVAQTHYNGTKESDRLSINNLLMNNDLIR